MVHEENFISVTSETGDELFKIPITSTLSTGTKDQGITRGGRGEDQPPKRISKEVREARKALREGDAKSAMTEYANKAMAFDKNRERLRAERLAHETVEPPPPKKKKAGLKTKK
jgi:hypothetical protein